MSVKWHPIIILNLIFCITLLVYVIAQITEACRQMEIVGEQSGRILRDTEQSYRAAAILHGAAEWAVTNNATGETEFRWKPFLQKGGEKNGKQNQSQDEGR